MVFAVPALPSASVAPAALSAAAAPSKEVTWTAPATWTTVPSASPMRKATLKLPRAAGDADDGELSVIAASGGVDQNVLRWAGQFGGAKPTQETRAPNGLKVTVVSMKGPYAGMGGGGAKENYMLLGAIVDLGEEQWFFKAIGPEKTMTAAKKDFDAFVASLRAK
jgi:hypothetical protein